MKNNRALKILFDTYWSSKGWKSETTVSPEDFIFAQNSGVMFQPVNLSHDDIVNWLKSTFEGVSLEDISNAFLVSLSTRRLELRSALGSYAIAKNFPVHKYQGDSYSCEICGVIENPNEPYDLSKLNFERYKWGGVRHEDLEYTAFDLEQFSKLEKVEPTNQDIEVMRQIIQIANQCEPNDKPRDLEKKLASVLQSNKQEREILIEILAYCGILMPGKRSDYFQSFPHYYERVVPPVNKIDWTYPVCWWRGRDGVNQAALKYYFPQ